MDANSNFQVFSEAFNQAPERGAQQVDLSRALLDLFLAVGEMTSESQPWTGPTETSQKSLGKQRTNMEQKRPQQICQISFWLLHNRNGPRLFQVLFSCFPMALRCSQRNCPSFYFALLLLLHKWAAPFYLWVLMDISSALHCELLTRVRAWSHRHFCCCCWHFWDLTCSFAHLRKPSVTGPSCRVVENFSCNFTINHI